MEKLIVVFTGWGFKRGVWGELLDRLEGDFKVMHSDDFNLEREIKSSSELYLLGWSKGGMEATEFAVENLERVSKVVLFSTTARFIQGEGYPYGWKKRVVERMKKALESNCKVLLDDFTQNMFSEGEKKEVSVELFCHKADSFYETEKGELKEGLDYLIETDIRDLLSCLKAEVLLIHGAEDRIVPVESSSYIEKQFKQQVQVDLLQGVGHAPFISRENYCYERVLGFLRGEEHDR